MRTFDSIMICCLCWGCVSFYAFPCTPYSLCIPLFILLIIIPFSYSLNISISLLPSSKQSLYLSYHLHRTYQSNSKYNKSFYYLKLLSLLKKNLNFFKIGIIWTQISQSYNMIFKKHVKKKCCSHCQKINWSGH